MKKAQNVIRELALLKWTCNNIETLKITHTHVDVEYEKKEVDTAARNWR